MTLAKDNEELRKCYLRYSKPPVLDMKWEKHDINVIEWAKIANGQNVSPLLNGD